MTADELLCDSLPASQSVFRREAEHLLADCSLQELKIITETMRTLKESLRKCRAD